MQHEQQTLQQKIFEIQEENNRINSKVEVLKNSSGETKDDATREKFNQDAVRNAMQQIEYLKTV